MNAGIIIIGDEILIGQVVDINSSWISREMNKIGFRTETVITVGDDGKSISDAIDRCLEVADVVFMTGGLGPTPVLSDLLSSGSELKVAFRHA